ncbi:MAG: prolipoprotein diacylglyceryl transferase [Eubacterium sp.]|nr:prolipoprotein diacylglyceryl transferase [Eubacterium sp.]
MIAGEKFPTYILINALGIYITFLFLSILLLNQLLFRKYMPLVLWSVIGLVIGAKTFGILSKVLYNLYELNYFSLQDSIKNCGIVYLGGLFGFLGMLWMLCKLKRYDFGEIGNMLAISIPLFHSIGRVGCYFGGCCYGIEYQGVVAMLYRIEENGEYVMRFPTQISESLFEMSMFVIFFVLYRKKKNKKDGRFLMLYLISYLCFRIVIEFYRGDLDRGVFGKISFSQIVCVLVIVYIIIIYYFKRRKVENENT